MAGLEQLPSTCDVLVVGGGPVGLVETLLLRQLGLDVVVVEQRTEVQSAPAAHVVSARTFEVLRSLGIDMDEVDALCQRPDEGAWVRWVPSLGSPEIGHVPFEGLHLAPAEHPPSPHPLRNLSQHRLEPLLRRHVPDLHGGVAWRSVVEDDGGCTSTVEDLATGESTTITSRFVVGCDGAGSAVRRQLGIEMVGPDEIESFLAIHVAADLRSLVGDQQATLYWITDPATMGTFVAHDLASSWVYMTQFDAAADSLEHYDDARAEAIVRRAGGIPDETPLDVRHVSTWRMTCQVASAFRSGSCFLVGDAAHRFPPTGGLGLNSGVADAQNLAWKLGLILSGGAADDLLATYEAERRPIVEHCAQVSLENALRLIEVWMALEVTDDPVASQAKMDEVLSTAEGRAAVAAAIANQSEHFDQLGVQLGMIYDAPGAVVVSDGSEAPQPENPVRTYVPSTTPGARLPHVVVEREGVEVSTLDLVEPGRFLLLTASEEWAAASTSTGPPVATVVVGRDVLDPTGAWTALAEIGEDGALLVRPDQHVAWRTTSAPLDASAELDAVLVALLGRAGA
jgi:2-polyprenyl-6-methoxyphenol hydroxylase-like FAD-dependent oxidoreductase